MTVNWSRLAEVLQSHHRFVLTSHVRPDCDALGSELGMAGLLKSLGKHVRIVNGDATPPNLMFLDPHGEVSVLHENVRPEELAGADLFMVMDTSAWIQLGPMADVLRNTQAKKVVFDHHVSEDDLGAESFKDPTAEATGRLVLDAAEYLSTPLTAEIATCLFAAIATDTGWFRFGSTNSGTYRAAATLLEAGAVPADIYARLYEQDSLARVHLRGLLLSRVVCDLDGRLAYTYAFKDDFTRIGARANDTEEVINMALAIAGVEFAVTFIEQQTGGFKLSFRSRCAADCSRIAEQFHGGGHKAAAGAFVEGSLEDVQTAVLDAVRNAMR